MVGSEDFATIAKHFLRSYLSALVIIGIFREGHCHRTWAPGVPAGVR